MFDKNALLFDNRVTANAGNLTGATYDTAKGTPLQGIPVRLWFKTTASNAAITPKIQTSPDNATWTDLYTFPAQTPSAVAVGVEFITRINTRIRYVRAVVTTTATWNGAGGFFNGDVHA